MTLPASLDSERGGRIRPATLVVVAVIGALLGVAAAIAVLQGNLIEALCLVPYLGLLAAVWWFTRGNLPVLIFVAYLIAPVPADNLLPQVFIYPQSDLSLRARDLLYLADLLLLAALVVVRPPWPPGRLMRAWLACLFALAAYPVVVGLVAGVGQSVPALLQGAAMPLRGIGIVVLVAWWARTRGWTETVRDLARTLIVCAAVIAAAEASLVLMAHGQENFSLFGFPLVTDGRPGLPGWGNNILANFLCSALAALTFLGSRLGWRLRWRIAVGVLLFVGLAYTEVRIAMLLALLVIEVPIVLAVVRRIWPKRGAVPAIAAGLAFGLVLGLSTVYVLPILNPRFNTLTPAFLQQYLPTAGGAAPPAIIGDGGEDQGGKSLSTRGALLRTAVQVWSLSPLVGTGWNGWGWGKTQVENQQRVAVDPHNGLTWLLADAGLLGLLLLYVIPIVYVIRRWDLWWLAAVPAVATALEMVNPNLRNGHFAVLVWGFIALAFAATAPAQRYTFRRWIIDTWDWVRGREPAPVDAAERPAQSEAPAKPASGSVDVGASAR